MALKDLLVHLDPGERTPVRLDIAVALARTHGARLTGIFGERALPEGIGVTATWPSADYVAEGEASKAAFAAATAGLAQADWIDANRGGDAELLRVITERARFYDLTIVGQHDETVTPRIPPALAEQLVIQSGRPVLVVPYAGDYAHIGRRPLIAWDSSRQSAHALNDALPLFQGCDEAVVVSLDTPFDEAHAAVAQVARHLAAHGIKAKTEVLMAEEMQVMDLVLNRVTDLDADLLVIGAHRHTVLPTKEHPVDARAVMKQMVVPTLVSR
jgi:nucleotide-binding universal stress UspA family protein